MSGRLEGRTPPIQPIRDSRPASERNPSLAVFAMGFAVAQPSYSASCDDSDFAEGASVDEIAGLGSISSRISTILNAGGIARANGCMVARTFGTASTQESYTMTGSTLAGQREINGGR